MGRIPSSQQIRGSGTAPGNTKTWALANDLLGVGDNWFPLDIERKTLCGGVERWSMFEHPLSGAEHDLHAHFLPLPDFFYLLDEADRELRWNSRRAHQGPVTPAPVLLVLRQ